MKWIKVRKNMIRVAFHNGYLKSASFAHFDANNFILIGVLHEDIDNHCNFSIIPTKI